MKTTYMLELTQEEMLNLFSLLTCLDILDKLEPAEKAILRKVEELANQ